MPPQPISYENLLAEIDRRGRQGEVAEFFFSKAEAKVRVRPVGSDRWLQPYRNVADIEIDPRNDQAYYFLSGELRPPGELRPGSGVIRVFGGKPEGPGGTLTCFLSSRDSRDTYFVAAGHVLSNFWTQEDAEATKDHPATASVYRYQKGFPATNSTRFLGKLVWLSDRPQPINLPRPAAAPQTDDSGEATGKAIDDKDIGIVKLYGEFDIRQRTTCYGSFGESLCDLKGRTRESLPEEKVRVGQTVMKCGAEETHWTFAFVQNPCTFVNVYGLDGLIYRLENQVILSMEAPSETPPGSDPPRGWSAQSSGCETPFAVPGDSGTIVVDKQSKRPVGMLIAGSILDGRYVMTPIQTLRAFWEAQNLVFLRG